MNFKTIFFDLDDTLYPHESGLWIAIKDRIQLFMHDELGLDWEEIPAIRDHYFETYGTTLRGIQANHDVDEQSYHNYVHQVDLEARKCSLDKIQNWNSYNLTRTSD